MAEEGASGFGVLFLDLGAGCTGRGGGAVAEMVLTTRSVMKVLHLGAAPSAATATRGR